jgi:hypothetical protein
MSLEIKVKLGNSHYKVNIKELAYSIMDKHDSLKQLLGDSVFSKNKLICQ